MTKFKSTSFKYLGRDLRRFTYEFQALQNFYTKPFSSLTLNWIVYFYFMLRAKEFQKFLEFSWFINSKTFNICTFQMNIFLFKISESGLKLFFCLMTNCCGADRRYEHLQNYADKSVPRILNSARNILSLLF